MSEPAVAADRAERGVGKKELATILKWSRMKLERRLEADAKFPVQARGDRRGGWEFDVAAVLAYLQPETAAEVEAVEDEPPAPAGRIGHQGEETARQRRDSAQAQLLEDKIRLRRGELLEISDLGPKLSEGVALLSAALNKLPDTLVRRLNLPEAAGVLIQQEVDEARRRFVLNLKDVLGRG